MFVATKKVLPLLRFARFTIYIKSKRGSSFELIIINKSSLINYPSYLTINSFLLKSSTSQASFRIQKIKQIIVNFLSEKTQSGICQNVKCSNKLYQQKTTDATRNFLSFIKILHSVHLRFLQ